MKVIAKNEYQNPEVTESKYQIGNRFAKRGRDAGVWEIAEVKWCSGSVLKTYVLRRVAFLDGTITQEIGEDTLDKFYIKIR